MPMWLPQTLNAWILFGIGALFFFGGFYHAIYYHDRVLSAGMVAGGVGFACLGLTEGFADPTPRGKILYRIAIVGFLIGLPILIYNAWAIASQG